MKTIHKALKELQADASLDDSFYLSYIMDKSVFMSSLKTRDADENDAVTMRRFENSCHFPADKIIIHGEEVMQ